MNPTAKLDKSVLFTFTIFSLIAIFISAYKLNTNNDCGGIDFTIQSNDFRTGEIVSFNALTKGSNKWTWDYGDGTKISNDKMPIHIYKNPGSYIVKLKVNSQCELTKTITIKKTEVPGNLVNYPKFVVPIKATVGTPIRFIDSTQYAYSWDWHFGESSTSTSKDKSPVYTFTTPGKKTISLVVNGKKELMAVKQIIVEAASLSAAGKKTEVQTKLSAVAFSPKPKPNVKPKVEVIATPVQKTNNSVKEEPVVVAEKHPTPTAQPKAPDITKEKLTEILELISKDKRTINDLLQYVCNNSNIPVYANENKTTLKNLCNNLKRKITISQITVIRSEETNCITLIKIKFKQSII